jgi:hypothetical protein
MSGKVCLEICKMKSIFRHIFYIWNKFDVSPITPEGVSKKLIIFFWGFNVGLFLANEFISECEYYYNDNSESYNECIVTKRILPKFVYIEQFDLVKPGFFVVVTSYDYEIPVYDVLTASTSRGPPSP